MRDFYADNLYLSLNSAILETKLYNLRVIYKVMYIYAGDLNCAISGTEYIKWGISIVVIYISS